MRHLPIALVLTLLLPMATAGASGQSTPAVDVTGAWVLTVTMSMGVGSPTLNVKQEGEHIAGVYAGRYGDFPVSGTVTGRAIAFSFTMGPDDRPVTISFHGEVAADGQSMAGRANLGAMGDATWSAARARPR